MPSAVIALLVLFFQYLFTFDLSKMALHWCNASPDSFLHQVQREREREDEDANEDKDANSNEDVGDIVTRTICKTFHLQSYFVLLYVFYCFLYAFCQRPCAG